MSSIGRGRLDVVEKMAALLREPFSFVDEPLDASVDYETDRVYSDTVRYNRIDLLNYDSLPVSQ